MTVGWTGLTSQEPHQLTTALKNLKKKKNVVKLPLENSGIAFTCNLQ